MCVCVCDGIAFQFVDSIHVRVRMCRVQNSSKVSTYYGLRIQVNVQLTEYVGTKMAGISEKTEGIFNAI